ncbi:MAG: ABC transporter permease [Trueperaceae bacterium]
MTRRFPAARPHGAPRRAFWKLLWTETKLTWRQPIGLFVGLGMPLLVLVVFANIPQFAEPNEAFGGRSLMSVYVPVLIVFVLGGLALVGLTTSLITYREQGVLRRMSTTPVPPSWLLGAQLVIDLVIATLAIGLLMGITRVAFGVRGPGHLAGFALALVLTAVTVFGAGLWVAAVARSAQAGAAISNVLFLTLMFFAGLWIPRDVMAPMLRTISDYSPLGAAVQALQSAWEGSFPGARPLLVLAAYTLLAAIGAIRTFRWE